MPKDDLVHLEVAFNMLGLHQFGGVWGKDMAYRVRLGRGAQLTSEADKMARWALQALTQCVENGWLPLFYYDGDQHVRRVEYFRNSDGFALHAMYPKPSDHPEAGGQVELTSGNIYPCMVDVSGFASLLQQKFGAPSRRRGPKRRYEDVDALLDVFFETHPTSMPAHEVIAALKTKLKSDIGRTTLYERINEARNRAKMFVRLKTPDKTADG